MTTAETHKEKANPKRARSRIIGYDFARALAVLGMIIVNFKVVMGAGDVGPHWLTGLAGLLEGRAAATFVVLAGAGISLLSKRSRQGNSTEERRQTRNLLLKRAAFLFLFGLLFSTLYDADILHFYGLYIAFAAFALYVPDRRLLIFALAFVIAFVVMILALDYNAGWNFEALEYTDFWTPVGLLRHMFFNGWHPFVPWTAFLLLGMWVGRQDIQRKPAQNRLAVISIIVLVIAELSSALLISTFTPQWGHLYTSTLFSRIAIPPMPFYMLSASSAAVLVIVICIRLTEHFQTAAWVQSFVLTGQIALTLYVAHVVIGMSLIELFGWYEGQSLAVSLIYALGFYAACIVFAHLWRRRFSRGPIEAVMRRLTG